MEFVWTPPNRAQATFGTDPASTKEFQMTSDETPSIRRTVRMFATEKDAKTDVASRKIMAAEKADQDQKTARLKALRISGLQVIRLHDGQ
jgi:hypothetical protein